MPSRDDFEAAGLYDPAVADTAGRLEYLEWLDGQGFTLEEMVHAEEIGALGALEADRRLVPRDLLSRDEAVAVSGLDGDHFDELSIAMGYVPIDVSPPDEIGYTEADAVAFGVLGRVGEVFSHDEALGLARVVGASVNRIAEAAVSTFLADIESPHLHAGGTELELSQLGFRAVGIIDELMSHLDPAMRRHVMQTVERTRRATIDWEQRFLYRYAVGFVDLVGFTSISAEMTGPELARFLREFEALAFESVTKAKARVVKLIGDEVMFAATDPADACRAAQGLMDAFADDAGVVPRGGLAYGDVLLRGGDYYGSVVNLASRLVGQAVPLEVLATDAVAETATSCRFVPAGRRMVRGFDEPVTVWSLEP